MLLALDDTDGPGGGCTTHTALEVLQGLDGWVLRAPPRLIRLNPNVPHKTRGNGAVVLDLGTQRGPSTVVGAWNGQPILAYPGATDPGPSIKVLHETWSIIQENAQPDAQPGLVLAARALPEALYWRAVRGRWDAHEARHEAGHLDLPHRFHGTGRSLAGCLGALAWPGPPSSYELLLYRRPENLGTKRVVDAGPLAGLDEAGTTFQTMRGHRPVCVPHGPDPVLLGLRGLRSAELASRGLDAAQRAATEGAAGWCLWDTNHASGDHVLGIERLGDAPEWSTVMLDATVNGPPKSLEGGHVAVPMTDADGAGFTAMAFEPTGSLCGAARRLAVGDGVVVVGAFEPGAIRLEKLQVRRAAVVEEKVANPVCPVCLKHMKSAGAGAGFRCRACGTKAASEEAERRITPRDSILGWHEADVGSRRHLHRPCGWD